MKSLFLLLALVFSVNANATSLYPGRAYTLPVVKLNGLETDLTARVVLDHAEQTITVELFEDRCGQLLPAKLGEIRCMAAATLKNSYTVPLLSETKSCGSKVFKGEEDQRPVDGLFVSVELVDHSTRVCRDIVASPVEAAMRIAIPRPEALDIYEMSLN
ncbi:MAG: hypothetical protein EOP05_11005 [Proteobacteria bacterium]|nr:MAG: hypothetical protein EOP05_11005 [Pseudomonadota bacterium]